MAAPTAHSRALRLSCACLCVLIVVASWIVKMALVQAVQGSNSGAEPYNKPYFLSYLTQGSYCVFLVVFLVRYPGSVGALRAWCRAQCRARRGLLALANDGDEEGEEDSLSSDSHADARPAATRLVTVEPAAPSLSLSSSPDQRGGGGVVHSSLDSAAPSSKSSSRRPGPDYAHFGRIVRTSLLLSVIYQSCGWLTNLSLAQTSLTVNTVVWNSACTVVFLLEGVILGHSLRDARKIASVLTCVAGVVVIATLSSSKAGKTPSSTETVTTATGLVEVMVAMVVYSLYEVLFVYATQAASTHATASAAVGREGDDLELERGGGVASENENEVLMSLTERERERGGSESPSATDGPSSRSRAASDELSASGSTVAPLASAVAEHEVHEQSPMEGVWSSCLFIGTLGVSILLSGWMIVIVIDRTGLEPFEWPQGDTARTVWVAVALDCVLNLAVLVGIACSSALFISCGLLLSIPASMLWDWMFHDYIVQPLAFLGIALLVLGFIGINASCACCCKRPSTTTTDSLRADEDSAVASQHESGGLDEQLLSKQASLRAD